MSKINLSVDEKRFFDSITWGKIVDLNDVKQLRRLERYMREEGFPQTAKVAKERLETLGETVDDSDETHKLNAQEIEGILDDLKSWEVVMKSSSRKASDPNAQQSSAPVRKIHKGTQDKSHSPDKNTAKEAYYEKWDKLAREIEEEGESDKSDGQNGVAITAKPAEETNEQYSNLSAAEKQWASEREKAKGNELFKAKDYTRAVESYSKAISLNPTNDLLFSNRAIAYFKMADFEKAEKDCSAALKINPTNLKALVRRCNTRLERNDIRGAEQDVRSALQIEDSDKELSKLLLRIEKLKEKNSGPVSSDTEKKQQSSMGEKTQPPSQTSASVKASKSETKGYVEGVRASPPRPTDTSHSSSAFGRTTATRPSAPIRRKVEIIEIDSDEEEPEINGAPSVVIDKEQPVKQAVQGPADAPSTTANTQSKESALEGKAESIPNENPTDTVGKLKDQGNSHFKAGRLNEANDCYTRGLKIDDKNPVLYSNRSLVLYKQAQYQKAEEDATRAIQWDPTYSKAYYRRSLARTALGNLEQAVEDLTKVKELWPEDPQIDREIRDLRNMQSAKQRELVDAEKQESFILNSKKEPQSSSSLGSIGSADNQGTQSKQAEKSTGEATVSLSRPTSVQGKQDDNDNIQETGLSSAKPVLELPKSLLEFERCITQLQGNAQGLAKYLALVEPASYQALFKEALTTQTLQIILKSFLVAKNQSMVTDELLVEALNSLSSVKRLELAALALPKQLKMELRSVINNLDAKLGQRLQAKVSIIC